MASEIAQFKDKNPIVGGNQAASASGARGAENIAKVFGNIAERSMSKATDYESDASKANLLQTHGMLQDIEAQSKIEMLKSPGHAAAIAKNAADTVTKIKTDASLNRSDRLQLEQMANSTSRSLKLTAAEKTISLARDNAKFAALSTLGNTLQSVRNDVHTNPERADALIQAQYDTIRGLVGTGVITAVEGANIYKQFNAELNMAHEIVKGIQNGSLSAADINTYHATEPGQIPLSNAGLPIDHVTAMNAEHHVGQWSVEDLKTRVANGERIPASDVTRIKSIVGLDDFFNYSQGAMRATGELRATTSWVALDQRLKNLKEKGTALTTFEKGYKQRLVNFFANSKQPGAYQNFIASTPEGARIQIESNQKQVVIDSAPAFGTPDQVQLQKHIQTNDNLNDYISKMDAVGIGMHYPDHLRVPIPISMLIPIQNGFNKNGDVPSAINNIQTLNAKNRVYAMNAFHDNPRKALTVLEIGNLTGKVDQGYLVDLMEANQADALGKKDNQEKFQQLEKGKEGYSDSKLSARIAPAISSVMTWLRYQGKEAGAIASAKVDQGVRYINYKAQQIGDYNFKNLDDYLTTYKNNTEAAYQISSGLNYVMDKAGVNLEDDQMQIYADYGITEARNKLLEFKTPQEVNLIFSNRPPIMVSVPGGRTEVVYPDGHLVIDKNGQPAYSELFTNSVWQLAEKSYHDKTFNEKTYNEEDALKGNFPAYGTGFGYQSKSERGEYIRGQITRVTPEVEGNIDLENRPKVFNKNGSWSTVSTATFGIENGKTVLLPTIINGEKVSKKEAFEHFKKTHQHMGIFNSEKEADKYDEELHKRMGWNGEGNKWGKK